ncbi:MAG TPA: phytanoyl-CoA dioxygenase family protein [Pseudomonadales bacterium]
MDDRELGEPYELDAERVAAYRRDGYVKLPQVLSAALLGRFREEIVRVVRTTPAKDAFPPSHLALLDEEGRQVLRSLQAEKPRRGASSTYARAFTQRFNLWNLSPVVERLVRSTRLARIAAELMGVDGVRLYHDQALFKEPRGGHTPWHCDQYYWPLSNDNTVTAWIPLQAVPREMGPVAFAVGSHTLDDPVARRLAISDESEAHIGKLLQGSAVDDTPYALGDVSFHSGWTFHRANANDTDEVRAVFTIIYMDRDMKVEQRHPRQKIDLALWLPGARSGDPAATPINPVLYERS